MPSGDHKLWSVRLAARARAASQPETGMMRELDEFTRGVLMAAGWLIVATIVVLIAGFIVSSLF